MRKCCRFNFSCSLNPLIQQLLGEAGAHTHTHTKEKMAPAARLRKLLLRYHPPGLILQYEVNGFLKQKPVDLLDLRPDSDLEVGVVGCQHTPSTGCFRHVCCC